MPNQIFTLKSLFNQLTPSQQQSFIKLIEAYIDCSYLDFQQIAEQLKWDRAHEEDK